MSIVPKWSIRWNTVVRNGTTRPRTRFGPHITHKHISTASHTQSPNQSATSRISSLNRKPPALKPFTSIADPVSPDSPTPEDQVISSDNEPDYPRTPRNVSSVYMVPLRREAEYNVPTCDLQMRSYHARNLDLFTDFALRAAYYLGLPAFGPVPLPKIIERWTVPKAQFIHKKSQENFERITMRRLIQIKDGHPESMHVWLAFLKRHAYYGIGMKANIYEFNAVGVGSQMEKHMQSDLNDVWGRIGPAEKQTENLMEFVNEKNARHAAGFNSPMTRS